MPDSKFKTKKEKPADTHTSVFPRKYASKLSYKGISVIEIAITYPHVEIYGNPRVSQYISYFYRDGAKRYYEKASHELYSMAVKEYLNSTAQHYPFRPYQVVQNFEVTFNRGSLLSIYYDRYEYTSGAHGNTIRYADTFMTNVGKHMKLEDFFEDSYYKSVIFEYITQEIKKQKDEGNSYYFDDYMKNVFRYFDENNYYLTEGGIAIFYQLYTIAAYAAGIPVFIIPFEEFGGSFKKRLFKTV